VRERERERVVGSFLKFELRKRGKVTGSAMNVSFLGSAHSGCVSWNFVLAVC